MYTTTSEDYVNPSHSNMYLPIDCVQSSATSRRGMHEHCIIVGLPKMDSVRRKDCHVSYTLPGNYFIMSL